MKKLYIVLAVLLGLGIVKVTAEDYRGTPIGRTTSISADYGGVDVATNSFYTGHSTVPTENGARGYGYTKFSTTNVNGIIPQMEWLVYGVNFSTGSCGDNYVSVVQSTSGINQSREVTRIYNTISISTSPNGVSDVCGGPNHLRWPIRAYGNLFFAVDAPALGIPTGPSSNPLNRADLLYYLNNQD